MILGKLWRSVKAQINKVGNIFWQADPIAQMQLEYDSAVEQLKEGRVGLEQQRSLVERVGRQVEEDAKGLGKLQATIKHFLKEGDRETAATYAVRLQRAKTELEENQQQLKLHEDAYENNLSKIKHATHRLGLVREKIKRYDAELKMTRAEAEVAQLASSFNFDITTDFGQIENVIQDKISLNKGRTRVSHDLSAEGMDDIEHELAMEKALAEDALRGFEIDMGLVTPETTDVEQSEKQLGPAQRQKETEG